MRNAPVWKKPIYFALVTDPRGGTHWLRNALNTHFRISVSDELFNPTIRVKSGTENAAAKTIIADWQREAARDAGRTAIGTLAPRKPYDGSEVPCPRLWESIAESHTHFVTLYRDNLLRQFLSEKIAALTHNWECFRPRTKDPPPLRLDPHEFKAHVKAMWLHRSIVDSRFRNRFVTSYEELLTNWRPTVARILEFLDVLAQDIEERTYKQEHRPLDKAIANYREIAEVVVELGCERWLA